MDTLIGRYILIGQNVYKIVQSNLNNDNYISLYNEIEQKFARHKNSVIKNDYYDDSLLFKKDSSFKIVEENNFAKLSCSNENLHDSFIVYFDNILKISKIDNDINKKFYFRVLDEKDIIYTSLYKISNIENKLDRLFKLFELHHPITSLPKTYGNLRRFQEDGIELLKFFDGVCKKYNLSYWIDYGTLLGAVRHKGYIPWDDDLDVCMMYYDFIKFENIIDDEIGEFRITYSHNFTPNIYKLTLNNSNKIKAWLDIFPFYYLKDEIDYNNYRNAFNDTRKKRGILMKNNDIEEVRKLAIMFNNSYKSNTKTKRIFRGFQSADHPLCDVRNYDDVFPLINLEFENLNLFAPRNYLNNLNNRYGNFWTYPDILESHCNWK